MDISKLEYTICPVRDKMSAEKFSETFKLRAARYGMSVEETGGLSNSVPSGTECGDSHIAYLTARGKLVSVNYSTNIPSPTGRLTPHAIPVSLQPTKIPACTQCTDRKSEKIRPVHSVQTEIQKKSDLCTVYNRKFKKIPACTQCTIDNSKKFRPVHSVQLRNQKKSGLYTVYNQELKKIPACTQCTIEKSKKIRPVHSIQSRNQKKSGLRSLHKLKFGEDYPSITVERNAELLSRRDRKTITCYLFHVT
jgi:hypothetical protein